MSKVLIGNEAEACGGVGIVLGDNQFLVQTVVLWLSGDEEATGATAFSIRPCDTEPCSEQPETVLDGYVALEEFRHGGRNRGEFEVTFEAGVISGTFDASPP